MEGAQQESSEQDDVVRVIEAMAKRLQIAPARLRLECSIDPVSSLGRTYVHIGPLDAQELRALAAGRQLG